ncbi:MAG: orotidine-5'-phosphate decarboxylase [Methanococcaceae archaeon]
MTAQEKLQSRTSLGYHIAVGLDTDINKIPQHLRSLAEPELEFNKRIIDATADTAACYKINFAFYEKDGARGLELLHRTIEFIPSEIFIIGDAKRGDIGNTSAMYAREVFEHFNLDAVTLHPYMGYDSVEPFLQYKDKISYILALTSNKGSQDFEKLVLSDGRQLFQHVIETVSRWNTNSNCGLVFGATNSQELHDNAGSFGQMPVLLPGIGAQGGSLEDTVKAFASRNINSYLINVSRSLLYKESGEDFARASKGELDSLNEAIAELSAAY